MLFLTFLCLTFPIFISAFYSIGYYSQSSAQLVNTGATFKEAPSAEQVADLIARLSGKSPLLWESDINLPSLHSIQTQAPLLLEVHGGVLPKSVKKIISASAFSDAAMSPKLEHVLSILNAHGINAKSKVIDARKEKSIEVKTFLENENRPVIVLHHETPSATHYSQRSLSSSNVTALTEFQISQYQICLWSGVLFVALIFAGVYAIVNMDVIPDSLLYAKFQSGRTEKRD